MRRRILYSKEEADFLSEREKEWKLYDQQKVDAIMSQIGDVGSVIEIGWGSGQILKELAKRIPRVVGVDESSDRLSYAAQICEGVELIEVKAEDLTFKEEFDAVLTSQMLHEVKMFGTQEEMEKILFRIKRALKPKGKYLLLNHLDPGEGYVEIEVTEYIEKSLLEFKEKFCYRPVHLKKLGSGRYEISRRDIQDFVTKTWSLNSPMEEIEMKETHASFSREEAETIVRKAGLSVDNFITFTNIGKDLKLHHISLTSTTPPWNRKFLLTAIKSEITWV